MIKLSQRLQFISAIVVIAGAVIKFFHLHSSADSFLFAGFFASGIAGIFEFTFSSERNFNSYAKLIASVIMCLAILIDMIFGTSLFYLAVILLAISFFSSALPGQKIPK